jgi:mycofactocin glycosyltransferase
MPDGTAWLLAVRLAAGGTAAAGRPIGSAISRAWWPVAVPAAIAVRRLRVPLAVLVLAPPLLDWVDRRPPVSPAHYLVGRLAGDLAYSIGLWQGCVRRRDFRALLPSITRKTLAHGRHMRSGARSAGTTWGHRHARGRPHS